MQRNEKTRRFRSSGKVPPLWTASGSAAVGMNRWLNHGIVCSTQAFRRHQMGQLLHRIGVLLPQWLSGPDLIRESRSLESTCWRELGYPQQPHFADDLPPFLMADGDGQPRKLSAPAEPMELARQMTALPYCLVSVDRTSCLKSTCVYVASLNADVYAALASSVNWVRSL